MKESKRKRKTQEGCPAKYRGKMMKLSEWEGEGIECKEEREEEEEEEEEKRGAAEARKNYSILSQRIARPN